MALMDICMPNIDGLSLVHILRERGYETMVIFITAYARFDYAQRAIAENALDYLLKPVSRNKLENVLNKARAAYLKKSAIEENPEYIRQNIDYLRKKYFSDLIFEEREISDEEKQKKEQIYYLNKKIYGLFEFVSQKPKSQLKYELEELCQKEISWYLYGQEYLFVALFLYDFNQKERVRKIMQHIEQQKCSFRFDIAKTDDLPVVYQELLVNIRKYYNRRSDDETMIPDCKEEKLPEDLSLSVRQAISYINENLNKPLSLQMIAMEVYLHPTYLSNIFKKQTGFTVVNYVNHCRIRKAKELLNDPQNKVCWVMEQVGFVNQRYFGKVFKEMVGMTPTRYKYEVFLHSNTDKEVTSD
jgi:two-component system response regulator YesN